MQVAFYLVGEITQVKESIPWVRCASGNVFKKISDSKNTYMIYENDQLTKLIKNTKNDTYLDGMTSDIVVNW